MSARLILVIERDDHRCGNLDFGLRCAGFSVDLAIDLRQASDLLAHGLPDLLLLGARTLAERSATILALRQNPPTESLPVMVIADRHDEVDAREMLTAGADDYVSVPIHPEELIARINALIRRSSRLPADLVEFGSLKFDRAQRRIYRDSRSVQLAPTEARVFEFFLAHPERLIPRELVRFRIWGAQGDLSRRCVDVSVCRLRRALAKLGSDCLLHTVETHGYRLSASPIPRRTYRRMSDRGRIRPAGNIKASS